MIVCPNCSHNNPDGADQCEACLTPLPTMTSCPNCGAPVQTDAQFCGQCGFNLGANAHPTYAPQSEAALPSLVPPDPLVVPDPLVEMGELSAQSSASASTVAVPEPPSTPPSAPAFSAPEVPSAPVASPTPTRLQQQTAQLLHVRTTTVLEIPQNLSVIHIGKPNDRIPPDIDVSGFPDSDVASRVHADIRLEGDTYYIEDVGSSNGTYINNVPLPVGNRHRLRAGDRISLGKGDMVTFLFQFS